MQKFGYVNNKYNMQWLKRNNPAKSMETKPQKMKKNLQNLLHAYTFKINQKANMNVTDFGIPKMERDGKNVIDETYKLNLVRIKLFK